MSEDRLEMLLQQADAAAGAAPGGPKDLALRVRRQARRQRQVRMVSGAAAAVLALVVGTLVVVNSSNKPASLGNAVVADREQPVPLAELQASVQRLSEEVLAECRVTQEALGREEDERRLAELKEQAAPDPLQEVNEQIDRAALTMVYQADRMYRELNLRESAIASYQQAVKLFPDTHWAEVARERLTEIQASRKGDAS